MEKKNILGVDLGATNVRGGIVTGNNISKIFSGKIHSHGTAEEVLKDVTDVIDKLIDNSIAAIGIGVPSVVDLEQGIVYDVQYIPSWKEIPLKKWLTEKYSVPVFVNNDANCFALGEHHFGKGKGTDSMIGITLGTGIGSGIIINRRLYAGYNCGAGEFGMIQYLDHVYEYYGCGQFFQNVYHTDGEIVFQKAKAGDKEALQWYREMGTHLGNTIKAIMYSYDPSLIIFGGSVRFAYPFFQESMWESIRTFAYTKSIGRLRIELSELENSGILGAAALYHDAQN
jgi:glucokinase